MGSRGAVPCEMGVRELALGHSRAAAASQAVPSAPKRELRAAWAGWGCRAACGRAQPRAPLRACLLLGNFAIDTISNLAFRLP